MLCPAGRAWKTPATSNIEIMSNPLLYAIKYVGVIISLVGVFVIAPDATRLFVNEIRAWGKRQRARALEPLAKIWPRRRRTSAVSISASGALSVSLGRASVTVRSLAWTPSAPVDERIEMLRKWLLNLEERHNRLSEELRSEIARWREAVDAVEKKLAEEIAQIRSHLEEQRQHTARLDARGFPVLGIGIVLTNLEEELARLPWGFGWAALIVAVMLCVPSITGWWREHRRSHALDASASG